MVSSRKLDLETLRQCGMTLHVMDYPAIIIENIKNPQAAQLTRTLLDFNELIPKEEMVDYRTQQCYNDTNFVA